METIRGSISFENVGGKYYDPPWFAVEDLLTEPYEQFVSSESKNSLTFAHDTGRFIFHYVESMKGACKSGSDTICLENRHLLLANNLRFKPVVDYSEIMTMSEGKVALLFENPFFSVWKDNSPQAKSDDPNCSISERFLNRDIENGKVVRLPMDLNDLDDVKVFMIIKNRKSENNGDFSMVKLMEIKYGSIDLVFKLGHSWEIVIDKETLGIKISNQQEILKKIIRQNNDWEPRQFYRYI